MWLNENNGLVSRRVITALWRWLLMIFVMGGLLGCRAERHQQTREPEAIDPIYGHLLRPLTNLPTVTLRVSGVELVAEIAAKSHEIATGMMYRTNVPEGTGMLFVFKEPARRNFYARNCYVPLSIAFIDPNGRILEVAELQPGDMRGVESYSSDVQFCLEVPKGWFRKNGIGPGAVITVSNMPLNKIFQWLQ